MVSEPKTKASSLPSSLAKGLALPRVVIAHSRRARRRAAGLPVGVADDAGAFVIVEAGAAQCLVGEGEAERLDEVQFGAVLAHRRMMLPVLGGISGWWRTTAIMVSVQAWWVGRGSAAQGAGGNRDGDRPGAVEFQYAGRLAQCRAGGRMTSSLIARAGRRGRRRRQRHRHRSRRALERQFGLRRRRAGARQEGQVHRDAERPGDGTGDFERLVEAACPQARQVEQGSGRTRS